MSVESSVDTLQVVVFCLLDQTSNRREEYGIGVEQVQEIRFLENITRIPKAPSHVIGVMNLRGKIISVIDLKSKLGFHTTGSTVASSRILVAEIKGALMGLLVDEVDQVMRISGKDIEPSPSESESVKYVKGIAKTQDRLIVILDLPKLLEG